VVINGNIKIKNMNKLDLDYQNLLKDILENGVKKNTRNGEVLSIFGRQIRHKMSDGFPLLTTKKMYMKGIITELLWFLRGDTSIKYLVDNGCHIWDGDAYKNWCKQFEVDPNNFNGEEVAKGHNDQCWGYPILDHVKPTSKEYKRGQINAYLEGKAERPFFYLTQEEFINKIKTDDEFAKKWGDLGPIYGKQWRSWGGKNTTLVDIGSVSKKNIDKVIEAAKNKEDVSRYGAHIKQQNNSIDQIQNLINDLKTNPDSRRLLVSAWNPSDLDSCVLPPCHYGFQVYTRELTYEERRKLFEEKTNLKTTYILSVRETLDKFQIPTRAISLMWNQRSVDTFLGLPFNIASYGLLLEIIAKEVNMVPDELIGNLGDTHLYLNHIEQAKEQIGRELSLDERIDLASADIHFDPFDFGVGMISAEHSHKVCDDYGIPTRTREPFPLPTLRISSGPLDDIAHHEIMDFDILNYQSHPSIKAPLSN
jgi:thymidylate synthase